uniref:Uncharacterized protein n=1 Tax=Nelumbo nucifera TaxID=4432 RepID=A0A822YUY0_NELNU|nr:TPA_asm: hypothetical protein HUJ06_005545 [Nelumbo nucifera]
MVKIFPRCAVHGKNETLDGKLGDPPIIDMPYSLDFLVSMNLYVCVILYHIFVFDFFSFFSLFGSHLLLKYVQTELYYWR